MGSASNDWWPAFSAAEYAARYDSLRAAMREQGLDALLVHGCPIYYGTDPGSPNLAYLAGYAPGCQGYVVFPLEGDPTLLVFVPSHGDNARDISVLDDVRSGNDLVGHAVQRLRELDAAPSRVGIVGSFGFSKVSIPLEHHEGLTRALPAVTFDVVTAWYELHRLRKSDEEMAFMRAAASVSDRAHEALRDMVRPGVTDTALQNQALRVIQDLGGRSAFSHVGSTSMREPSFHYPTFYATNRVVQRGDVVLTELAAGFGGYFGKIYGTLVVGEPTPVYRTMLQAAAASHRGMYDTVRPGMRSADVDTDAAGAVAGAGYRSLSYVAGWSTYNTPPAKASIASQEERQMRLEPALCLNVCGWVAEPDGPAGVWIGDTGVVGEDGLRPLHRYPVGDLDFVTLR